jgi:hypothetical protein
LKKRAATYVMGGDGFVPPHRGEFHMDTGCVLNLPYDIVPVAYRVHTHHLGDVVSGYAVLPGVKYDDGLGDEWFELGRMSPRQKEVR